MDWVSVNAISNGRLLPAEQITDADKLTELGEAHSVDLTGTLVYDLDADLVSGKTMDLEIIFKLVDIDDNIIET